MKQMRLCLLMVVFFLMADAAKADTVVIGEGTKTSNLLPTYCLYNYSFSQQIYTAEEIGTAGTITSVAFCNVSEEEMERTLDIYMVATSKQSFSKKTDWIANSESDKVFSGNVLFAANGEWTVIYLNTPFVYDGTSNLAITVDDNTGSWESTIDFLSFDVTTNQALTVYGDDTDFLPSSPDGSTSTLVKAKNQVRFEIAPVGLPVCLLPTDLVVSDITKDSATLTWESEADSWNLRYKAGEDSWTEVKEIKTNSFTLTGLEHNTKYTVSVQANCGTDCSSGWTTVRFATQIGVPFIETFSTDPDSWSVYSGNLANVMAGTETLTPSTSGWHFGKSNDIFDAHAYINIFGTNTNYWLVSPSFKMEDHVQLSYDLAYTAFGGRQSTPQQSGKDDKFVVLITTDGGNSWTILRQYDNAGSIDVLNALTPIGIGDEIDLSNYKDQNVALAFYAESTEQNADNNLHIDNVSIDYIPNCVTPVNLAVGNLAMESAIASWTAGEEGQCVWDLRYKKSSEAEWSLVEGLTEPSYTFNRLEGGTHYDVQVRANCGAGNTSKWTRTVSFMTNFSETTVAIGVGVTTSNPSLPTYSYYKYSYTQQIYTAREIGRVGRIESVGFFNDGAEKTRSLDIYLVATDKTSFKDESDWVAVKESDKVFSGSVKFEVNSWNFIDFDIDYAYDGTKNLILVVDDNTDECSNGLSCRVFNAPGQSLQANSDKNDFDPIIPDDQKGSILNAKNQIILDIYPFDAPKCPRPLDMTWNNTSNSTAVVNWDSEGDLWNLKYKASNDDDWLTENEINNNSFTLESLSAKTIYDVWIQTDCGSGNASKWLKRQFASSVPLPYSFDFENKEEMVFWTVADGDANAGIIKGSSHEGYNSFWFTGNTHAPQYLVSPYLTGTDEGVEVEFYYSKGADGTTDKESFLVGYSTSSDLSTFNWGEKVTVADDGWHLYYNTFPAGTRYVAVKFTSVEKESLLLDDILFSVPSLYPRPTSLSLVDCPTPNSAILKWTPGSSNQALWDIAIKGGNESDFSIISSVADNPYTIGSLSANTNYMVMVRFNDGKGNCSKWSEQFSFITLDSNPLPTNLFAVSTSTTSEISWKGFSKYYKIYYRPHIEGDYSTDFEDGLPVGWTTIDKDGDGYGWKHSSKGNPCHSGTGCVYSESYDNAQGSALTPDNWLISPKLSLDGTLKVWLRGQDILYAAEHFAIYVSTKGNTDVVDFTEVKEERTTIGDYLEYTVDLSSYEGQMGYVAIRHFNVTDESRLVLDDFGVYISEGQGVWTEILTNESAVELSGLQPSTSYEYKVAGVSNNRENSGTRYSYFNTLSQFALADATQNSQIIADHQDELCDVMLTGRTLYKDNSWNTLCLPFTIDKDDLDSSPLSGAVIRELSSATLSNTNLTLNFEVATGIEAGKPYIIKWAQGDNIVEPLFKRVTLASATPTDVDAGTISLKGIYDPYTLKANDKTVLYMGAENKLYYPTKDVTINAFRAYFQLAADTNSSTINGYVLNVGDDTDGILESLFTIENETDSWYTIDGRKLSGKPSMKGVYVSNGKKVVVK